MYVFYCMDNDGLEDCIILYNVFFINQTLSKDVRICLMCDVSYFSEMQFEFEIYV